MSKELELHKAFIDGLVERKDSMTALWVKGNGFPKTEDYKAKNDLLATLTPEQKGVLADMLQDEHIAGIHDTLWRGWSFIRTVNPIPTTILRACTMTSSAVVTEMNGRNKRRREDVHQKILGQLYWRFR